MDKKRKPNLSPDAAKLLEQYRNSGKTPADRAEGGGSAGPEGGSAPKPNSPPPPSVMRRSGTRGK